MTAPDAPPPARPGAVPALGRLLRRWPIRCTLAATLAVSLLLVVFPGLDLWTSGLFHVEGAGFPAEKVGFLKDLRGLGQAVVAGVAAVAALGLLGPLVLSGERVLMPPRAALFLLASLILGPGLLVNTVLKDNWGRARPRDVTLFGGDLPFSGPWAMVDSCRENCSFVSGEASSAVWLTALALLAPPSWRPWVLGGTLAFAAVMSVNRIAFGGHFLSDVLIGWLLTLLVVLLVHGAVYGPRSRLDDARIAAGLGRAGDRAKGAAAAAAGRAAAFLARFR